MASQESAYVFSKLYKNDQIFIKTIKYHVISFINIGIPCLKLKKQTQLAGLRSETLSTKL